MKMAYVNGSVVHNALIKPVYIKNSEIQQDRSNRISDFEMETGHWKQQCKNERVCRVCRKPGYAPGSPECKHYVDPPTTGEVVVFQGMSNPISNFYPCSINVFGEKYNSAEHAYQLTKAIRACDLDAAKKVREAEKGFGRQKDWTYHQGPAGLAH
uniref:Uncharacterized protein n=1 Tax=Magallana gigas TaxID=29159 RepID=A0A8W8ILC2_MAGGI